MMRCEYFKCCLYFVFLCDIICASGNLNLDNGQFLMQPSLKRISRQTKCGVREFKCKSGECINEDNQCDGKDHCKDGSDETAESCRSVPCPPFLFRCAYGACINGDLECDGKADCKDNSDETTPKCKTSTTKKPQRNCGPNSFQCDSGECIDDLDLCDGIKSCRDGSDETIAACSNVECPGFTFRCAYGGCVSREARCNQNVECLDGSDEKGCLNNGTVPPVDFVPPPENKPTQDDGSCTMPPQPLTGSYQVGGKGPTLGPGDIAPASTALTYRCRPGFKLGPKELDTIYCLNAQWIPSIPQCKQVCPPFNSNKLEVKCTLESVPIDCEFATSGTIAKIQCIANYEDLQISENPYRFCQDGSWDSNPPNCIPGRKPEHVIVTHQYITNVFVFVKKINDRTLTELLSGIVGNVTVVNGDSSSLAGINKFIGLTGDSTDISSRHNTNNNSWYFEPDRSNNEKNHVLDEPIQVRFGNTAGDTSSNVIKNKVKDKWTNKFNTVT